MKFKLPHLPGWLEVLLGAVVFLRIPSFVEPYYYGDETIYLTLGQGIRKGVTLYKNLHDNKPPLLYLIAAVAGNEFWFKLMLAAWSLAAIIIFWKLVKSLFEKNTRLQIASTIIFALLTTLPALEGNIANAENFMIAPTMLAFFWLFSKKRGNREIFAAGLAFGVAALFKIPAAFEMPTIIVYWLITSSSLKKEFVDIFKRSSILFLGFLLPILATFIWYGVKNALPEYIIAAFLQNIGYLSSWRPDDVQKSFLARNLPLLIRASTVLTGLGIIFLFKKKLSRQFMFICIWTLFALFAITLSERPYPHYLLQAVPAISIALGMLFSQKNIEQVLVIVPLVLFSAVPVYYKYYRYPTIKYYQRFAKFVVGRTNPNSYLSSFGRNVPRDYKIADFLTQSMYPNDKVFIWDTNASNIYALSRHLPPIKYVVNYHINDYADKKTVALEIGKSLPRFIVITPESGPFVELLPVLRQNYIPVQQIQDAQIFLQIGT